MTAKTATVTREAAQAAAQKRYGDRIRAAMFAYEAEKRAAAEERNKALEAALLLQPARAGRRG